ncbi:hypothetical protein E4T39_08252 [Aureobasidium subglaciale]|nr:hypothetical protein E4T39_08252 [Aureobasidium subglaciale]
MDNVQFAWQKTIWISLTIEGDRKKLISSAQRAPSGLACRNIFNTQFIQLFEAYDLYGPHKGLFVPRLEQSDDPKVAFELHWDRLGDVVQGPGTASTPVLAQPSRSEPTLDSILEEHHQRKTQDNTTTPSDENVLPFAESEYTAVPEAVLLPPDLTPKEMSDSVTAEYTKAPADVSGALPIEPCVPTLGDLTPLQIYTHAKADFERRVDLARRERTGLLEIPASGTASSLVDMGQVLDDLEKQTFWMQTLLKNYYQEHRQNEDPRSKECRQVVEALDSSKSICRHIATARTSLPANSHDAVFFSHIATARILLPANSHDAVYVSHSFVIWDLQTVANACMTVLSQRTNETHRNAPSAFSRIYGQPTSTFGQAVVPPQTGTVKSALDTNDSLIVASKQQLLGNSSNHPCSCAKQEITVDDPSGENIAEADQSVGQVDVPSTLVTAANSSEQRTECEPTPCASTKTGEDRKPSPVSEVNETTSSTTTKDAQTEFRGVGRDTRKDSENSGWKTIRTSIKLPISIKWQGFW